MSPSPESMSPSPKKQGVMLWPLTHDFSQDVLKQAVNLEIDTKTLYYSY